MDAIRYTLHVEGCTLKIAFNLQRLNVQRATDKDMPGSASAVEIW